MITHTGGTNHKRNEEDILLFISLLLPLVSVVRLLLSVVTVRDMIENSPFFVSPVYVLSFDQNLSSFNNQNLSITLS